MSFFFFQDVCDDDGEEEEEEDEEEHSAQTVKNPPNVMTLPCSTKMFLRPFRRTPLCRVCSVLLRGGQAVDRQAEENLDIIFTKLLIYEDLI